MTGTVPCCTWHPPSNGPRGAPIGQDYCEVTAPRPPYLTGLILSSTICIAKAELRTLCCLFAAEFFTDWISCELRSHIRKRTQTLRKGEGAREMEEQAVAGDLKMQTTIGRVVRSGHISPSSRTALRTNQLMP